MGVISLAVALRNFKYFWLGILLLWWGSSRIPSRGLVEAPCHLSCFLALGKQYHTTLVSPNGFALQASHKFPDSFHPFPDGWPRITRLPDFKASPGGLRSE